MSWREEAQSTCQDQKWDQRARAGFQHRSESGLCVPTSSKGGETPIAPGAPGGLLKGALGIRP